MNIKGLIPTPMPQVGAVEKPAGKVRMQESADRDADGRRERSEEELKRHLTDEELKLALDHLAKHPGLVANNLTVRVEQHEDHRVILIEDRDGQVVRRLSESQLWSSMRSNDKKTGAILDKAS